MNTAVYEREKRFEKWITVLIALTTIFAAVTTFLENLATNRAEFFERQAQEYSIQATTSNLNGALRFSFDWQGAYQHWRELDLMITNALEIGDEARAALYSDTRDQLNALSPLLQPPYFDDETKSLDSYRYEADLYIVESTVLWEEFENKSTVANAWDQIANAFVLQLTTYAIVLSLFGLSVTLSRAARWLFVTLAGLIMTANLLWTGSMLFFQIEEIPSAAIQAYADGVGLSYQGRHSEAIEAFDRALSNQPDYANALYNRGFSRLYVNDLEGAVADFEATINAGKDDENVLWNLGWAYYLLGRYDQAVRMNQAALTANPELIAVRTNQGLAMLANGRLGNAAAEYQIALDEAVHQVAEARAAGRQVSSSLWFYMDAAATDLDNLVKILSGKTQPWGVGPSNDQIIGDRNQIRQFAIEQIKTLKEYTLSLEYYGTPPPASNGMTTSSFSFVQEVLDENGAFVEYVDSTVNEFGINEIGILFDFSGFQNGQHEVWKIYVNGTEDTALRVESDWSVGESGSAIKFITYAFSNVFVFTPGEYVAELYVDSRLVQSGTFYVNP